MQKLFSDIYSLNSSLSYYLLFPPFWKKWSIEISGITLTAFWILNSFFFFAKTCSMWDLSSPARDQTCVSVCVSVCVCAHT